MINSETNISGYPSIFKKKAAKSIEGWEILGGTSEGTKGILIEKENSETLPGISTNVKRRPREGARGSCPVGP